jgi:Tripartite tricarboxylate transporter family receptor
MFRTVPASIEYIRAGKLRALAVTSAKRSEVLPDLSTVGEFVPGYETSAWAGIGAPKNTPAQIIDKLNEAINAGLPDPKLKARFADLGGTVMMGAPADFGRLIADETEKWGKVPGGQHQAGVNCRYSITFRPANGRRRGDRMNPPRVHRAVLLGLTGSILRWPGRKGGPVAVPTR